MNNFWQSVLFLVHSIWLFYVIAYFLDIQRDTSYLERECNLMIAILLCLSIQICEAYKVAVDIEMKIWIKIKIQNMDNSVVFKFVRKK